MAAVLDVIRGQLNERPPPVTFPINWPGDGTSVPFTSFPGGETPDPLSSCPGYSAPAGAPIILQLGPRLSTNVTAASLTEEGNGMPVCVFDGATYTNPDAGDQSLGRAVLAPRGAVVMIPSRP